MSVPENPAPFDLRMLPSWLKEGDSSTSYAHFDGEDRAPRGERRPMGNNRSGSRPPQARQGAPSGQNRDQGNRRSGPPGQNRPSQSGGGRPADGRGNARPDSRDRRGPTNDRRSENRPPPPQDVPAKVTVNFLPEDIALSKVTEQLQSAPIAYPLFAVAKMFLQRPERHCVQIKPLPETTLFRLEGTPHLSTDRARLESIAFQELWQDYFRVDVQESPEIKGNFVSVARSSLTGKVFGPTSHHTYQAAIHKEYEERFSRRMSFDEYRRNIETTNNPEAIEQWKTEARRVEVFHLLTAEERSALTKALEPVAEPAAESEQPASEVPTSEAASDEKSDSTPEVAVEAAAETEVPAEAEVQTEAQLEAEAELSENAAPQSAEGRDFKSKAEAENYFRSEILSPLIVPVENAILSGQDARNLVDRRLVSAVRIAWETEMRYPLGLVNGIRVKFTQKNLHIFKFKKRVLLISSLKPVYLDDKSSAVSPSIRRVLQTIQEHSGIDRKNLAEKIAFSDQSATEDEKQTRKNALVGDLYWLVRQGNVIEFSDGTFDLPMGPRALQAEAAQESKETKPAAAVAAVAVPELDPETESSPQAQEQ